MLLLKHQIRLLRYYQRHDKNLLLNYLYLIFSWRDDAHNNAEIDDATIIGVDQVNGISCNQFAFREQDIDWQICIQRGDVPLPLKLVITSKEETSQPQYMAILKWDTAPVINKQSFTFVPNSTDHLINFAKKETKKETQK